MKIDKIYNNSNQLRCSQVAKVVNLTAQFYFVTTLDTLAHISIS